MEDKIKDDIGNGASNCPETAQDLINVLRSFPPGSKLSFAPFNLHSVVESGEKVQFEMSELEGVHYNMRRT